MRASRMRMLCMQRLLLGLLLAAPLSARAQDVVLRTLPAAEVKRLEPIAARGELALVESQNDGRLKQITVYTTVGAPPDKVRYVLGHPTEFPQFIPNVVKLEVTKQLPGVNVEYNWEVDVPLVNLKAKNRMVFLPAAGPDDQAAPSIEVSAIGGDIKRGKWRTDFVPLSDGRTMLVYHTYLEITEAGWFIKKMVEYNRWLEHGIVLASAIILVKAIKLRAEALANHGDGKRPKFDDGVEHPLAIRSVKGSLDQSALGPLLDRGQVALIESFPDGRLRQASLMTYVYTPQATIYRVVSTPTEFEQFVPGLKRSKMIQDNGREAVYELEFRVPVLPNVVYRTYMRREPQIPRIRQIAIEGDAKGSVYGWDFLPIGPKQTLAIYMLNGQLRKANWLLKQLIKSEPFFEHGLNVSVALATLMSMRGHAEGWR